MILYLTIKLYTKNKTKTKLYKTLGVKAHVIEITIKKFWWLLEMPHFLVNFSFVYYFRLVFVRM